MEQLKLNWTVKEYIGTEVYHKDNPNVPLLKEDDLKVGDEIICVSWIFTVEKEGDNLYGKNKQQTAILQFNQDDRKCWVCGGIVNIKAIKKLNLSILGE